MGSLIVALFLLQLPQADAGGDLTGAIDRMDREMSGLLDAYLEAVPECPAREDTPFRLWLLDLAWLRATGSMRTAESLQLAGPAELDMAWSRYLKSSSEYLSVFRYVRDVYSSDVLPDSSLSLELESRLIDTDSLWREAEAHLLDTCDTACGINTEEEDP